VAFSTRRNKCSFLARNGPGDDICPTPGENKEYDM